MSLLPDTASFHEKVQTLFVAYRARGVALSPKDVELVEAWAALDVPFEIVARGMRRSAERALWDAARDDKGLRSLAACRAEVKREISRYLKRSAGQTQAAPPAQEPFHLARHKKLKSQLKKIAKQHPPLADGLHALSQALAVPHDFDATSRQEELTLAVLARLLPFPQRLRLLREARGLVEKGGAASAVARRESLRFHRAALVRRELDLPGFW